MKPPSKNLASASPLGIPLIARAETVIPKNTEPQSPDVTRQPGPGLQVYQIELEMQNEELRRIQEELETERARYFDFYNLAPIGYCTISDQGLIEEANLATAVLLDVPVAGLIKQRFTGHIHQEDRDAFYLLCNELTITQKPQTGELRLLKADGKSFWTQLSASIAVEGKSPPQIRLVLSDITLRKAGEAALRESDQRFRDLVDSTDGIVWLADANTFVFESISRNVERLLGYPVAEWLQPGFWAGHIHPEDRDQAVKYCVASTGRMENHDFEYRFIAQDGRVVWLHDSVKVVAENGRPRWLRGLLIDVSERKRIEQQIASVEAQLRQSQKMEAIGQLAGGIAHDFNNLLTGILGNAALLHEEKLTPAQLEMVQHISQTGNRAASLTRQLLLFSRREVPVQHDLDLNQVVADMHKLLRRILGENINLQLALESQPQIVHADASMLDQVLLNLSLNARDAMPEGGKLTIRTEAIRFKTDPKTAALTGWRGTESRHTHSVRTSVRPADPAFPTLARAGDFTCLSVTDEGCGMTPEICARIFEPFFTTKAAGRGTGLGLATVYGIVQQHQGWIEVDSEPGRGSTFRVYLPRLSATLVPEKNTPPAEPDLSGHGETIMLVEDETSVRTVLRIFLERAGYRIIECASGSAALELWPKHKTAINLLLTDMVMPGAFGGVQLAQKLLKERPDLKVIITSGFSSNLNKDRKKFAVEIAFIPKPFDQKKVLAVVRAELDAQKAAQE